MSALRFADSRGLGVKIGAKKFLEVCALSQCIVPVELISVSKCWYVPVCASESGTSQLAAHISIIVTNLIFLVS